MSPGKKSTEFFALMLYAVVLLANGTEYVNVPWDQLTVFGGMVAAYGGFRSWVKSTETKAAGPPLNLTNEVPT